MSAVDETGWEGIGVRLLQGEIKRLKEGSKQALELALGACNEADRAGDRADEYLNALDRSEEAFNFVRNELDDVEDVLREGGIFPLDPTETLAEQVGQLVEYTQLLEGHYGGLEAIRRDVCGVINSDQRPPNADFSKNKPFSRTAAQILVDILRARAGRVDSRGVGTSREGGKKVSERWENRDKELGDLEGRF